MIQCCNFGATNNLICQQTIFAKMKDITMNSLDIVDQMFEQSLGPDTSGLWTLELYS
jgi:hypothetical protein